MVIVCGIDFQGWAQDIYIIRVKFCKSKTRISKKFFNDLRFTRARRCGKKKPK